MKNLFSVPGLRVLEALSFTKALYAFDFDGTLAPIVSKPEDAGISSETMRLLNELAELAPTAIISGRSVSDLKQRVSLHGNLLIGNHGVEGLGIHKDSIAKAKGVCAGWADQIRSNWGALKSDPGTFVEDKTYSLALHYRKSRNKKKAKLSLFALIEKLQPPPRVILGKSVMNLIPAGGPHKGVALLEAMIKLDLKCAFYIGDDDTDEDVFSLPDSRIITARVGKKKASQAQFFVERQNEINRVLKVLIKAEKNGKQNVGN